jgi:myo-inositol 2-dehydrogenase/D-chiro-inositol 1-dehydrogenase
MKVCMIGCGDWAQQCHGPAQRKLSASHPDVMLAACCDIDPGSSRRYREAFGFERHYAEMRKMLSTEKPDAVVLAVPPTATCAAASLVLELGFPLLLEKPPGMSPVELRQLIAAQEKGGARAQVAFNRHYMPVMQRALELLDSSFAPESVRRVEYDMIRFERWDPDFSTTAIHALDAALFLARSPFRAAAISFEPQRRGHLEATDVTVEAECISGSKVFVNIRPVSTNNSDRARIHGVDQSLVLKIPVSPQSDGDGCVEHWRSGALASSFSDHDVGAVERLGVLGETEAFLNAVRSSAPFSPRLEDCRQQVALMEAVRNHRSGAFQFKAV